MTNRASFLLILLSAASSCNTATKPGKDSTPVATKIEQEKNSSSCFRRLNNKDTTTLRVDFTDKEITGELIYNLYEKDKNTGTINGKMNGDTLIAEYTFMSEGINSVREVAFLKKDQNYVEGYGEMEEKDGKTIFKNTAGIRFDTKATLVSVACAYD